jgi:hypothetical protein
MPDPSRRYRILDPTASYTFAKYFDLSFSPKDILLDLDCELHREVLNLPRKSLPEGRIASLREQMVARQTVVSARTEMARRETLITPILFDICIHAQIELNIEYPVRVNDWLKGTLDYYLDDLGILIVEAKQADLDRGFVQLAVEMVAIDQWTRNRNPLLYGAVTNGEDWKFTTFDRKSRVVTEDRKLYRNPEELALLMETLAGIAEAVIGGGAAEAA